MYKVSIIIPIYNSDESLNYCVESLIRQTIGFENIEVIMVDDGSTDNSLRICEGYAKVNSNVKIFTQKNAGPSVARNLGIKNATGKYIMFLDSDDTLETQTIEKVTEFFDEHYDEVDLVSYYDQYYKNGQPLPPHERYRYLEETGIYDLNEYPYVMQVRLNIAVKNVGEHNLLFKEDMDYQEDQFYCSQMLMDKLKIGYVKEAQYNYLQRSTGIVGTNTNAIKMFKNTLMYFKAIYSAFDEKVPEYYQVLFLHDLGWKLKQFCLYPHHYSASEFSMAKEELAKLLKKTAVDVIVNHPTMDYYHKFYFLEQRDRNRITVMAEKDHVKVICDGKVIKKRKKWDTIVFKLGVRNSVMHILASFKSIYGSFICPPKILVKKIKDGRVIDKKILDTHVSSDSYYRAREMTNKFWAFDYAEDISDVDSLSFYVLVDGFEYPCSFWFMPSTALISRMEKEVMVQDGHKLTYEENTINIESLSDSETQKLWKEMDDAEEDRLIRYYRKQARKLADKKIWLYYDCKGVRKDNAYYQFLNDICKNDGIERYYVTTGKENEEEFSQEYKEFLISFGSHEHKILFLASDLIVTAYIEPYNYRPFMGEEFDKIVDVVKYKLIYLQHGILHATLPWKYTPERELIDKIVVSSGFEKKNFINNYGFKENDVIATGMARFANLTYAPPQRKILFAPTWRQYLICQDEKGEWIKQPERFKQSKYFKEINQLINSDRLNQYLENEDIQLHIKLHPIFERYIDCFNTCRSNIRFIFNNVRPSEYAMFFTDFSSYVFDYVFLKRPIMYFVPDMEEFKAGMNQYRQLDLPFEEAFGELTVDAQSAVDEIIRIADNGFGIEEKYKKRMDEFFFNTEGACDRLYNELMLFYY